MRASQHSNVGVARLTHRSRVFQHKQGSRFHLLWNPLSKQFKIRQHADFSFAILLAVITAFLSSRVCPCVPCSQLSMGSRYALPPSRGVASRSWFQRTLPLAFLPT